MIQTILMENKRLEVEEESSEEEEESDESEDPEERKDLVESLNGENQDPYNYSMLDKRQVTQEI